VRRLVFILRAHWIREILRIVMAVAEQVVITGIKSFRIFAHEAADAGVISASTILVDAELRCVFAAGEQETVVSDDAARVSDSWCAEGVVAIAFDDVAGGV